MQRFVKSLLAFAITSVSALPQVLQPPASVTGLWPAAPLLERAGRKAFDPQKELLYKSPRRIWPDLPYTDTEVKAKTLRGLLWMLKFMGTEAHLQGNENNYLTMLSTMHNTSRDPYFRRIAWEESRIVIHRLIASGFFNRADHDIDTLLEYMTLFCNLGIRHEAIQNRLFQRLEKERPQLIQDAKKMKSTSLDGDELYDALLRTYYLTNLKHHFPGAPALKDLPDLSDFFEALPRYQYHLEGKSQPDFSKLSRDDISTITDDLYNITHIIFVVCNYNCYHVPKAYFKREIGYILKYAGLICSRYHNDPDLLTEVVYVLTLFGFPKEHPVIKEGWIKMLETQRADGSWEAFGLNEEKTPRDKHYSQFHATWVAVDMINEPVPLGKAPFYKPLKKALKKYAAGI